VIALGVFLVIALGGILWNLIGGGWHFIVSSGEGAPAVMVTGLIVVAVLGGGTVALMLGSSKPTSFSGVLRPLSTVLLILTVVLGTLLVVVCAGLSFIGSVVETCKCNGPPPH
jgi:hypothetical protein